jgi:hypothetical protein
MAKAKEWMSRCELLPKVTMAWGPAQQGTCGAGLEDGACKDAVAYAEAGRVCRTLVAKEQKNGSARVSAKVRTSDGAGTGEREEKRRETNENGQSQSIMENHGQRSEGEHLTARRVAKRNDEAPGC